MDPILVTIATMHKSIAWKKGVYQVPDEMPVEVAAKLVEISHAEPFKGEVTEDETSEPEPEKSDQPPKDPADHDPTPPADPAGDDPVDGDVSDDGLLGILDGNVKQVTEALGRLDDAELKRLEDLEAGGQQRKGVWSAIANEQAERAGASEPE